MDGRKAGPAIFLVLWTAAAGAELQNVIVNGSYSVRDEDRFARVVQTLNGNNPDPLPPAIRLVFGPSGGVVSARAEAALKEVQIPAAPPEVPYRTEGRVFLSFYAGIPDAAPDARPRVHLTVSVQGQTAAAMTLQDGAWHHRLLDLGAWAGQSADLAAVARISEGQARDVVLALPRLVVWYGPRYAGVGGISMGSGQHGMPRLPVIPEGTVVPDAVSRTVTVRRDMGTYGALLVERFDCLTPATIRLQSSRQTVVEHLEPGLHWLALALGDDPQEPLPRQVLEGEVEQGPYDVIPNFLAGDEKVLAELAEAAAPQGR